MSAGNITPARLIVRIVTYYAVLGALIALIISVNDALEVPQLQITETSAQVDLQSTESADHQSATARDVRSIALFLVTTLVTTIVVMVPITWTYLATRYESGASKVYVRSLLLMPICATTVVLLIQDSLALAFGLAALVAAVRFRVSLPDTVDGIYIFAAICVGLAGGIGYMGVALVMAVIFTLTHAVLWQIDFGRNPVDEARQARKAAKLAEKTADASN